MRAPLWVPHFRLFYTRTRRASTTFITFFLFFFLFVFCSVRRRLLQGEPDLRPYYTPAAMPSTTFRQFFTIIPAPCRAPFHPKASAWNRYQATSLPHTASGVNPSCTFFTFVASPSTHHPHLGKQYSGHFRRSNAYL
jgi:hypothetical protein